jgi:protein TonB
VLSIVVNVKGRADRIKVEKSLGKGLDENTIKTIKKFRFKPATLNGKPVAVRTEVCITYKMED